MVSACPEFADLELLPQQGDAHEWFCSPIRASPVTQE